MNEYSERTWELTELPIFNRIKVNLNAMTLSGVVANGAYRSDLLWPKDCVKLMELIKPSVKPMSVEMLLPSCTSNGTINENGIMFGYNFIATETMREIIRIIDNNK